VTSITNSHNLRGNIQVNKSYPRPWVSSSPLHGFRNWNVSALTKEFVGEPKTDLPSGPPDSITIGEFLLTENYGRVPFKDSKDPFTCGISGRTYSNDEHKDRVEALSRALSQELGWQVNAGTEWDKVMGVFSLNTVSCAHNFFAWIPKFK
jgi:hypothetical protein